MKPPCNFCKSPTHSWARCQLLPITDWRFRLLERYGYHSYLWALTRSIWIANHRADRYICHYCGCKLRLRHLTLDHMEPLSKAPELRYEQTNLVPACSRCNNKKNDHSHDRYRHTCQWQTVLIAS